MYLSYFPSSKKLTSNYILRLLFMGRKCFFFTLISPRRQLLETYSRKICSVNYFLFAEVKINYSAKMDYTDHATAPAS